MDKCTVLRHRKIPEAVRRLMSYAFDELGSESIWCSYLDGNNKLKHVREECGFVFYHINREVLGVDEGYPYSAYSLYYETKWVN